MTKFQTKSIQLITENDNVSVLDKDKTKWSLDGTPNFKRKEKFDARKYEIKSEACTVLYLHRSS